MEDETIQFRNALGSFATGVTIVTTVDGKTPLGMTANSFNSVSLDPKLILWSLAKSSRMLSVYEKAPGYIVHVLGQDQIDLSNTFARPSDDRFAGLDWEWSALGLPFIKGCAAHFECTSEHQYDGGDHIILVGRVKNYHAEPDRDVLCFHRGRYACLAAES